MTTDDNTFMTISTAEEIIAHQQEKIRNLERINTKENAAWIKIVDELMREKHVLETQSYGLIKYIKEQNGDAMRITRQFHEK